MDPQIDEKSLKTNRKLKAEIFREIDEQSDRSSKKADTLSPEEHQDQ